ncbi:MULTISPECIES: ArsR/SmtB family transcription factor [Mycobacterium simiae complex]|uniref:Metalloregulator ArsR/SmtB family transcription factor n=2 Tax=Mycobacterium simiae complex TaxID=2249310 RepID=A0ABY3V0W4_MYCLN|nr:MULTISPECIES: metalloregulator ArsR/SmtB family transcription factor [Mycobacterium simiae complex]ORJ54363.1 transcriptional regulator [Mycobacterium simiae]ULP45476.1 metalloregulator ArsR/SmtB family transcription factor [Mycobacterium lentiflavum]
MSKSRLPLPDASVCAYAPLVTEPLSPEAAADIAAKLKALADPIRLRLFSMVASRAGGEACVCDVSEGFDVTQPTISHHLKVLKDAGLLTSERRASWVYYAVVPEALTNLSTVLRVDVSAAKASA